MKLKKILLFIPIITFSLVTIVSCQACSNQNSQISFLDPDIAYKLNMYDEFGESKIVQEYAVKENHEIGFQIGTNVTDGYYPRNYKKLDFSNIDFANLLDLNNHVLPNAKSFVTNTLHIVVDNDNLLPSKSFDEFYWLDGNARYPRFVLKLSNYKLNVRDIKEKFNYTTSGFGYELWNFRMPKTTAVIAIVDQTNWHDTLVAKFQVKVSDNDLLLKNNSLPYINKNDILYTNEFNSDKYLTAAKFNDSILLANNISDLALDTKNLSLILNKKIEFKICIAIDKTQIHILDPYHAIVKNEIYNIAVFIGKVFIRSDISIGNR